jgi:hypothetical protein
MYIVLNVLRESWGADCTSNILFLTAGTVMVIESSYNIVGPWDAEDAWYSRT